MKKLKVLVTAGGTVVPIDQVRVISNIFKGETGTAIARYFAKQGAEVTLLTSNPDLVRDNPEGIRPVFYRTYDDLALQMGKLIGGRSKPDVVIHSAAVSDYKVKGVWVPNMAGGLREIDASQKVSSKHPRLFLELVLTDKLADFVRSLWGFKGPFVKFKLEVGKTTAQLLLIAEKSRETSGADLIVANCLAWASQYAYVGDHEGFMKVSRRRLSLALYRQIEKMGRRES